VAEKVSDRVLKYNQSRLQNVTPRIQKHGIKVTHRGKNDLKTEVRKDWWVKEKILTIWSKKKIIQMSISYSKQVGDHTVPS